MKNVLALCTIVGLCCWIGYLLAENERVSYDKAVIQERFERLANVKAQEDSIIKAMPEYVPQGWDLDSNGIYNLNN